MIAPEEDVLETVCDRVKALVVAVDEDMQLLGAIPPDIAAFEAMTVQGRVGSRALLKTVEQLEEQMMRLFRIILHKLDVDTKDLFARDIANRMEELHIVIDAHDWMDVGGAAPLLRATAENAFTYLDKKEWPA